MSSPQLYAPYIWTRSGLLPLQAKLEHAFLIPSRNADLLDINRESLIADSEPAQQYYLNETYTSMPYVEGLKNVLETLHPQKHNEITPADPFGHARYIRDDIRIPYPGEETVKIEKSKALSQDTFSLEDVDQHLAGFIDGQEIIETSVWKDKKVWNVPAFVTFASVLTGFPATETAWDTPLIGLGTLGVTLLMRKLHGRSLWAQEGLNKVSVKNTKSQQSDITVKLDNITNKHLKRVITFYRDYMRNLLSKSLTTPLLVYVAMDLNNRYNEAYEKIVKFAESSGLSESDISAYNVDKPQVFLDKIIDDFIEYQNTVNTYPIDNNIKFIIENGDDSDPDVKKLKERVENQEKNNYSKIDRLLKKHYEQIVHLEKHVQNDMLKIAAARANSLLFTED